MNDAETALRKDEPMNVQDVEERVKKIEEIKGDDEVAHIEEDQLWKDVLKAIATNNCANPSLIAEIALKTRDIDFSRWYA